MAVNKAMNNATAVAKQARTATAGNATKGGARGAGTGPGGTPGPHDGKGGGGNAAGKGGGNAGQAGHDGKGAGSQHAGKPANATAGAQQHAGHPGAPGHPGATHGGGHPPHAGAQHPTTAQHPAGKAKSPSKPLKHSAGRGVTPMTMRWIIFSLALASALMIHIITALILGLRARGVCCVGKGGAAFHRVDQPKPTASAEAGEPASGAPPRADQPGASTPAGASGVQLQPLSPTPASGPSV